MGIWINTEPFPCVHELCQAEADTGESLCKYPELIRMFHTLNILLDLHCE